MTDNGMRITLLGTGTSQGVPVVGCSCKVCQSDDMHDKRLRTSVLLQTPHTTIVIDAGPDFRQQMLSQHVDKLDAVLITHSHKDHTGGLDDVRAFNWIQKKPMEIFARKSDQDSIKREFAYAFAEDKYPGVPDINLNNIDGHPFLVDNLRIVPIHALHHKMPVYGFRIGNFSYLTDANTIEQEELDKMKGSKVIVINALRQEKHISHFTLEEATEILRYLRPEKGYITHISHQMGLHAEVQKMLPTGVYLAWDGMQEIV